MTIFYAFSVLCAVYFPYPLFPDERKHVSDGPTPSDDRSGYRYYLLHPNIFIVIVFIFCFSYLHVYVKLTAHDESTRGSQLLSHKRHRKG